MVSDWAELILPETAKAIGFYNHPFYGKYPAITINHFGKGDLLYEGCRPSDVLQEKILLDAMERSGIKTNDQNLHWPLITKKGINDFGKTVHFFYNYSSAPAMVAYQHNNGRELTAGLPVKKGEQIKVGAWDVKIVEEN